MIDFFGVFRLQDARDDVGGAQDAGMLGILVRTGEMETRALVVALSTGSVWSCDLCVFFSGKYRDGDENKLRPPPHLTCDSFPEAVDHILKNLL